MNEIKVRKTTVARAPWMVVVPADVSEKGKRERRVFARRADAEALVAALKARRQARAMELSPVQLADATLAYTALQQAGGEFATLSLTACVRQVVASATAQEAKRMRDAQGRTVGAMCAAVLARVQATRSAKYAREVARVHATLTACIGAETQVEDVTPARLEAWLAGVKGATARKQSRTIAGTAFEHAVRLGWIAANPARRTERVSVPQRDTRIFTVGEVDSLLSGCGDDVELRAWLAVLIFAGIRPEGEASRITWGQVGVGVCPDAPHGYVEVAAKQAKTAARRLVRIGVRLAGLLAQVPAEVRCDAARRVKPVNARRRLAKALAASGVTWSQDVTRHTFASYHLAHVQDLERLRREMGHRGTDVLYRHYHALVLPQAAREFWRNHN